MFQGDERHIWVFLEVCFLLPFQESGRHLAQLDSASWEGTGSMADVGIPGMQAGPGHWAPRP